ncbi:MAG TPA: serine/threonine-protein kinase, partial [Pirellulales bacterium]|nr:serine/threonine-protein kinase [Pirellulales bacterium]
MNELDLFAASVAVGDPDQREALLNRECSGRPDLRSRIDQLLEAHFKSHPLLDQPAPDGAGGLAPPMDCLPLEVAGAVIAGKYKLLERVGEGGMGSVWMADQTEPIRRTVAVKLIRVECGQSQTILARFEAERQAIALMDHPHIAKLLDAGTTETGSPFFVMELVKGVPLTDYCDTHKLSIPQRLALFAQICSAVQHAHQKGIIHRDLKPTNILVESHDGKPVPKVIDFGLAKAATGLKLSERTLYTALGSVMGTPQYMAPEQASFNALDVDTRADIYALGVVLYELLTGTTPLTRATIKQAQLDEVLKLIREQEAPTPSSRLSLSESQPSVAANRQ